MAHKRLFIYAALLAICYLVGVTWAETASQTLQSSSSNNNSSQLSSPPVIPAKSVSALPTAAAPKVISSTAAISPASNSTSAPTPDCECAGALLPRVGANGKELPICPECKCSHVARNTNLIKVVVIIVIWIISILVIYMLFLMCLDPLLNKRVKANYQEHTNEDDEPTPQIPSGSGNQELGARANVLNRVGHQQDKWKRQVREQRRHIYDRHTMLN